MKEGENGIGIEDARSLSSKRSEGVKCRKCQTFALAASRLQSYFLFSDRMTALEEIKEVATASADSALRPASTMVRSAEPNQRVLREFRGRLDDMRAELRAFYKFAVLQAEQTLSHEKEIVTSDC